MDRKRLAAAILLSVGLHAALLVVFEFRGPANSQSGDGLRPPVLKASVSLDPMTSADRRSLADEALPVDEAAESSLTPQASENASEPPAPPADSPMVSSSPDGGAEPAAGLADSDSESQKAEADGGVSPSAAPADGEPRLLTVLDPVYPTQARRLGVQGTVVLEITVDIDGRPKDCRVLRPRSHRILESSAVEAAMTARYDPAMKDGKPTVDTLLLRVHFQLET